MLSRAAERPAHREPAIQPAGLTIISPGFVAVMMVADRAWASTNGTARRQAPAQRWTEVTHLPAKPAHPRGDLPYR